MCSLKSSNPLWFANRKARPRHCSTLRQRPGSVLESKTTFFDSNLYPKTLPGAPQITPKVIQEPPSGPSGDPRGRGGVPRARILYFSLPSPRKNTDFARRRVPSLSSHPAARSRPSIVSKSPVDEPYLSTPPHTPRRVGGFKRPAATCADPERALAPQLPRRDEARRSPNCERAHRARTSLRRLRVIGLFPFFLHFSDSFKFPDPRLRPRRWSTP